MYTGRKAWCVQKGIYQLESRQSQCIQTRRIWKNINFRQDDADAHNSLIHYSDKSARVNEQKEGVLAALAEHFGGK